MNILKACAHHVSCLWDPWRDVLKP